MNEISDVRQCRKASEQGLPIQYVVAAIRSAALHARLQANEADTIGLALMHGLIGPEAALLWARDVGVLDLVADIDIEAAAQVAP